MTKYANKLSDVHCKPSLMELAQRAGFLTLSPSDLVFEAKQPGFAYYDYIISLSRTGDDYEIYLAKLDARTNVEWFQTIHVPISQLVQSQLPINEIAIITLGILTWRQEITQSRLLCLVSNADSYECLPMMEALKKACGKFKCSHHVIATGQQKDCAVPSKVQIMKLLTCQHRSEIVELPTQAISLGKFLLSKNGNPFLCLCFLKL
ncbi:hypothetical protein M3Y94_00302500 [Aphelenchoides besseyi]|nr:hypothetical protein M3Y94_00302500 [Aphelenchoides besseyi]KAI6235818.1 hypothetical protein M3Y95_00091700 [Aphelenchoides besseyi]